MFVKNLYYSTLVTVAEVRQPRALTPMELEGLVLDPTVGDTRGIRYTRATGPEQRFSEVLPLVEAAWKYRNRLTILGDAGIGKTTALYLLMLRYADTRLKSGKGPIPLYISLGAYHRKEHRLNNLLAQTLSAEPVEVEVIFRNDEWIFLFDGINEVPADHRTECFREVRNLIQGSSHNYIFSSRYEGYVRVIEGPEVEVQPLLYEQIKEFAENYLNRLRRKASSEKLMKQLTDDIQLMDLAKIPFYLVSVV